MEVDDLLSMVNRFDDAKKANLKKILYGDDGKIEVYNTFGGPNSLMGSHGCGSRDQNPLFDEIINEREFDLQVELLFNSYSREGDSIAHIKAFEMKFE